MNLVMIDYERVKDVFSETFLTHISAPNYPLGKDTERSWIFKSDGNIASNGNKEVEMFNRMCMEAKFGGYNGIMITKNPPIKEG